MVERAKQLAADELEASPEDMVLDLDSGRFHVAGTPEPALAWGDLAGRLDQAGASRSCAPRSTFRPPQPTFPFGAHVAVVDVDTETGGVELRRLIAVDDAGKIINPLIAEGQVHGGLAAGIASGAVRGADLDEDGNPQNASFVSDGIPGPSQLPSFELVEMETPTPINPLGAKGSASRGRSARRPRCTTP